MTHLLHCMDPADRPFLLRCRRILCLGRLALFMMLFARIIAPAAETQQQPEACGQPQVESVEAEATLNIRADSQEKDKDVYHLRGHVEVTYQEMKLTADEATYDEGSQEIAARGHITFTDPDAHLEADEAHYNFRMSRGEFLNGHGHVRTSVRPRRRMLVTENQYYFQARKITRLDRDNFTLEGARLSSCENEAKGWSVAAGRARMRVDDKVVAHGAFFRLLRVPLFYAPLFINSIAPRPRQSGLLLPHLGHSSQKGFIVGDGVYWAVNPSADLLLGLENFSARGPGAIGRFRARPSSSSEITMDYFGVADRGSGLQRQLKAPGQSLRAVGQASDLGHGFRGVVDVDYISSLTFRQTFTDSFAQAVTSEAHQTGFMTRNFDAYSINLYASRYQNFLCAQPLLVGSSTVTQNLNCPTSSGLRRDAVSIRQTPSFSFSGMDRQVGRSPFYFSFETAAAGVGRAQPGFETPRLSERVDFSPRVTLRSRPFGGFHLTPSAGLRATHYGTSLIKGRDSLNRLLGDFSVDLRPPSFDKILGRPLRGHRFKHVIEPDVRYHLVRAPDAHNLTDVVRFDETDILAETNEIEYSLNNSILIRKEMPGGTGDKPQARELVSLRLSQKYYFDPTFGGALAPGQKVVFEPTVSLTGFAFAQGRRLSPLVSVLKFSPFSNYDTELRADFNPSGGGVLNAGVTAHVHRGPAGLAATEFFVNRTAALSTPVLPAAPLSQLPSFNLLRVVATYGEISRKGFSTALGLDYNFSLGIAHQAVSQASYNFGCFALDFEYRRFALGTLRRENQFRVALSLANVGTFGNLKPRERLY
jgi:LPS-assembly protein